MHVTATTDVVADRTDVVADRTDVVVDCTDAVADRTDVVVARGWRRLAGLIGRRLWPAGVALEIPRCRSVHTFGMRFALDLVWLDADRRVVRIDRGVPPWRVRSCRRAASVLELRTACVEGGGFEGPRGSRGHFVPSTGTK